MQHLSNVDIVYFPNPVHVMVAKNAAGKYQARPSVDFGVCESALPDDGVSRICRYTLNSFHLIDGIPAHLYPSETDWHTIPKDMKKADDISFLDLHTGWSSEMPQAIEAMKSMRIDNRDDLVQAVLKDWLVPISRETGWKIEVERQNGKYRLVRKSVSWTMTYLAHRKASVRIPSSRVFRSYSQAMACAEAICADRLEELSAIQEADRLDDLLHLESRMPSQEWEKVRLMAEALSCDPETRFRVWENKLLIQRHGRHSSWETLHQW